MTTDIATNILWSKYIFGIEENEKPHKRVNLITQPNRYMYSLHIIRYTIMFKEYICSKRATKKWLRSSNIVDWASVFIGVVIAVDEQDGVDCVYNPREVS